MISTAAHSNEFSLSDHRKFDDLHFYFYGLETPMVRVMIAPGPRSSYCGAKPRCSVCLSVM